MKSEKCPAPSPQKMKGKEKVFISQLFSGGFSQTAFNCVLDHQM
jgi:hypothetical protein